MARKAAPKVVKDIPELHSALAREYVAWEKRHFSDDGYVVISGDIKLGLDDGSLAIEKAYKFRRTLFAELVGSGVEDNALQTRLAMSDDEFQELRTSIFGVTVSEEERNILRNAMYASYKQGNEQIDKEIESVKSSEPTPITRARAIGDLLKLKKLFMDSMASLMGLLMPEQKVVEHKVTYAVELVQFEHPAVDAIEVTATPIDTPLLSDETNTMIGDTIPPDNDATPESDVPFD